MSNIETLQPLALAVIEAQEKVHGAATRDKWRIEGRRIVALKVKPVCELPCGGVKHSKIDAANAKAIASAHHAMPAFIAIAKGQLDRHRVEWLGICAIMPNKDGQFLKYLKRDRDYHAEQYTIICQHLASIPGDSDEIQALRKCLEAK